MQDIRRFHNQFNSNNSKSAQDNFILKHTQQELPKRCQAGKKSTQVVIKYFISTKNQENMRAKYNFPLLVTRFCRQKKIRKIDTLIDREEYLHIFSEFGTVRKVPEELTVMDWKAQVSSVLKPAGAPLFKFAPSKRIILTKGNRGVISVQGEEPYRTGQGVPKGVLKKGKTLALIKPRHLIKID